MTNVNETSLGPAKRRGPLQDGERVQLTDAKARRYTIQLRPGDHFNTHRGWINHEQIIGLPDGSVVKTDQGHDYLVLRPLLSDYVMGMPRGAAIVYPKDAGQIVQMADIFDGARVVEAGVGSGALSMSLLQAIGRSGRLVSVERRAEFAEIACHNVDSWFGGRHPAWSVEVGDLAAVLPTLAESGAIDRIVLDMLAPWENIDAVAEALCPGGLVLAYVATTTQLSRFVEDLRASARFTEPQAWESLVRGWHVEGLAVRPNHRMIGHTGFLVTARVLAPGVLPPERIRRPAPGVASTPAEVRPSAHSEEDSVAQSYGARPLAERKIRRLVRDLSARTRYDKETGQQPDE